MLARKEAELTTQQHPRFMNQELMGFFPLRTLEAIKGRRRRRDYKDMVAAFISEINNPSDELPPQEDRDPPDDPFLDYLEGLPALRVEGFHGATLQSIIREARTAGKEATVIKVALYLREVFPAAVKDARTRPSDAESIPINRRKARRQLYATTQRMWLRDRRRCITGLLNGLGEVPQPPRGILEPFWAAVMTTDSTNKPAATTTRSIDDIWQPITEAELKWGQVEKSSSSGPDGISPRLFRSVHPTVVIRIYNLLMWCGKLPESLLMSRTVFLPKKSDASEPGDFRPITIPSVIVRGLHKILARRMERLLDIDTRQRAFRRMDGCADNTFLLDTILRYHRRKFRPLYVASLDISKAFDSVSHPAIKATLSAVGLPSAMVEYLAEVYAGSRTILEGENWRSRPIHPRRGVRQGDPLSPIIFNAVTHRLLRSLPSDIGASLGNQRINAVAYADDILLFATTPAGLQRLIDTTAEYLSTCGMTISPTKCLTIAIIASGHEKKTAVDPRVRFLCDGHHLPALSRSSEWRYLGIKFTPEGKTAARPMDVIRPAIDTLTRAPLKPQQRLFALRTVVIPKLYHQLALGSTTIGLLNKVDRVVRITVRRWLALPHDVPSAYIHAAVRDGGLGIPSLRWQAPLLRRGRLLAVRRDLDHDSLNGFVEEEIALCTRRLTDHGTVYNSAELVGRRWRQKLYQAIDGCGLQQSSETPHQHQWVADGTRFLSGKDYINLNRLRISAIPTKSRSGRGRHIDRRCRAGCLAQETINHVLQQCHRTHAARIRRHDAILAYLERGIRSSGYDIHREPRYTTAAGLRKPDMVAVMGRTAVVVDAQVVGEQLDLHMAHRRKVDYYSEPGIIEAIKRQHQVTNVKVTSATLSWKGVWSPSSASELRQLGLMRASDTKIVSTRVLIGGLAAYRVFSTSTSVGWRAGVG